MCPEWLEKFKYFIPIKGLNYPNIKESNHYSKGQSKFFLDKNELLKQCALLTREDRLKDELNQVIIKRGGENELNS